jgi:hypothetical protein
MNIFYVYHLIDPRNNLPFYVGKGKNERMFDHESAVKNGRVPQNNKFLFRKIKKILSLGLSIEYKKIYENLDEKTSLLREIDEENRLKSLGINLCNIVPCGTGGNIYANMSPSKLKQVKEKISKSSKGRIVSDETREKCRLINLGRVRSEEFKLKVSKSKIGKKLLKETRIKMSESHKGVNFSEEHCKSISDSLKGRKFTDEHKNKLADIAKKKIGNKNPNYKQLTEESELFILSNIDKPIYWIKNNLKEKVSYNRLKNRITLLKESNKT